MKTDKKTKSVIKKKRPLVRGIYDTVQMMSISGHKDQRTFFDYIQLSSDEIADKIMEKFRQSENVGNEGLF